MTTKHTPGPWIGAGPSFGYTLPRYTTEIVTELEFEDGGSVSICRLPFNHHDDENEANAHLIAAAPDLLEALEVIYPMLPRSLTTVAHGDPSWTEAIRKVEDAIAKAKRRQVEWRRKGETIKYARDKEAPMRAENDPAYETCPQCGRVGHLPENEKS